jgi:hypothetical protein
VTSIVGYRHSAPGRAFGSVALRAVALNASFAGMCCALDLRFRDRVGAYRAVVSPPCRGPTYFSFEWPSTVRGKRGLKLISD